MTISTTTRKAGPYTGNGVSTSFPFAFKVFTVDDPQVILTDSAGVESVLVRGVNYSAAMNADQNATPGGTITYPISGSPLASPSKLTVLSVISETQGTDLVVGGGFNADVIEDRLDYVTALIQQHAEKIARSILTAPSDAGALAALPIAVNRAGKFMAFDVSGQPTVSAGSGGGDTSLRADLASTTSGSDGARLVGARRTEAGSIGRSLFAAIFRSVYMDDFVNNVTPGTTDCWAGLTAAMAAALALGGGSVILPPQRIKLTQEVARPPTVSLRGAGRFTTVLEAAHNGIIVSCLNTLGVAVAEDQFALVDEMGFKASGASTPTDAIKYQALGFTRVSNIRVDTSVGFGLRLQFVLDSRFDNMNLSSGTGIKLFSTSTADGCNLNIFTNVLTSGCATAGLVIDAHGSYQNTFNTCAFFNQAGVGTAVDHVYASKTRFINCTGEANLSAGMFKLRGGDGISFEDFSQVDPYKLIDSATFGARNVVFLRPLLWDTDSTTPNLLLHDEISLRDPIYTLDEAGTVGNTHEEHHLTWGSHSTGRQFAHFPGYANATSMAANTHVTPFGGVIQAGMYNRIGSFDFSNVAQWTVVGTAGATDPFGGTTAYNMNTIANSTHGGNGLGAAATGRTFTFQVWAKFVGRVRLGIGTTAGSIQKFGNFYSSYSDWHLLSLSYTSPTDAGTTPFLSITTDQATVMWRPCHYEARGPQPALQPNRNLAGIATPMMVEDTRIVTFSNAAPGANAWTVGDTVRQTIPIVGNPKGWRNTVAGSPGTWVSEGNL